MKTSTNMTAMRLTRKESDACWKWRQRGCWGRRRFIEILRAIDADRRERGGASDGLLQEARSELICLGGLDAAW